MEDFDIVIPDEFKKLYKESGPIIKVPHQILRQKTSPVIKFGHKLKQTIKVMKKTMEDHRGLGLAAPQVGIGKQICLAYTPWDGSEVLINPLITAYSDEVIEAEEGCLSIPGLIGVVSRSATIVVRYQDVNGVNFTKAFDGLSAVVIQHEVDHLNGILFTDRVIPETIYWESKKNV
jgi:peptide deformylase